MAGKGFLSGIFGALHLGKREEEAPAPPPHPVISIDSKKSQADIIAGIQNAVAQGADVNAPVWNRETPLEQACEAGLTEVAKALIDAGAAVNPPAGSHTPFMSAVEGLHLDIMQLLVDKGANPLQPDGIPQDAMVKYFLVHPWEHRKEPAFQENDRACLQFLLDHGLKMEEWNKGTIYKERQHLMPLAPELYAVKECEEAAKNGEWSKVFKMIDAGMSADAPGTFGGMSPLAIAIRQDDIDTVNMLLDRGAGIETWCNSMSPIMHAADAGAEKCFTRLVRAGADITEKFTADRYPDTSVVELAGLCKTNPNMKAFAENAIAHRDDPIDVEVDTGHKVTVHKPLHFRHAPAMG